MSRSSTPLALSVVTLTNPESVAETFENITRFDDRDFGFNHNQTWSAMPSALRGVFEPAAVIRSFRKVPPRVQNCIAALCALGKANPLETRRFQDYPEAGLRTIAPIAWDPAVVVRVKACCWYIRGGQTILPVLQPRKEPLSLERLAVYLRLVRQAYCQGDWVDALIQIIDLSGDEKIVQASPLEEHQLPRVSDGDLAKYVKTFVEAKGMADEARAKKPKVAPELPLAELLDLDR